MNKTVIFFLKMPIVAVIMPMCFSQRNPNTCTIKPWVLLSVFIVCMWHSHHVLSISTVLKLQSLRIHVATIGVTMSMLHSWCELHNSTPTLAFAVRLHYKHSMSVLQSFCKKFSLMSASICKDSILFKFASSALCSSPRVMRGMQDTDHQHHLPRVSGSRSYSELEVPGL